MSRLDTIIVLGGVSPMDAAKVMWLRYETPTSTFIDMREKFFDIRKRAFAFPTPGRLAKLICIPTTAGTGAEITPLITADSGFDALTDATEAFVSVYANDFSDGPALHAIKLIFRYLPDTVRHGAADPVAREKMHNAGSIAGMAFGNAFLLPHVIRYNGAVPAKLTNWPKYEKYIAPSGTSRSRSLGLPAATPEEGVESYAAAVERLRTEVTTGGAVHSGLSRHREGPSAHRTHPKGTV